MNKHNNVCFIDNFQRTPIFEELSTRLNKKNVYWITLNKNVFNSLRENFLEKYSLFKKICEQKINKFH